MNYRLIRTGLVALMLAASLCNVGCSASLGTATTRPPAKASKKMPPGQAKKLNGDKSAKKYAPGHN